MTLPKKSSFLCARSFLKVSLDLVNNLQKNGCPQKVPKGDPNPLNPQLLNPFVKILYPSLRIARIQYHTQGSVHYY